MSFIVGKMKWVMLVTGALTCTMALAAVAPQAALQSNFGEVLQGPLAEIVVRNWGALITLVGAMLIYGAFRPAVRPLILTVAAVSKLIFITLVLVYGAHFLSRPVGLAVAFDASRSSSLLSTSSLRARPRRRRRSPSRPSPRRKGAPGYGAAHPAPGELRPRRFEFSGWETDGSTK